MGDVVQESHEHDSYEQSVCIRASGACDGVDVYRKTPDFGREHVRVDRPDESGWADIESNYGVRG